MDVFYIPMQSNFENSPLMVFSKLSYIIEEFNLKNSPKMKFCFFHIEILYTILKSQKNSMYDGYI